jgi:hypothetical protein
MTHVVCVSPCRFAWAMGGVTCIANADGLVSNTACGCACMLATKACHLLVGLQVCTCTKLSAVESGSTTVIEWLSQLARNRLRVEFSYHSSVTDQTSTGPVLLQADVPAVNLPHA